MEKKIYADYHGPRCTRECDGEVAQWKYYGPAKKSRAAQTYANHHADFIGPDGLHDLAARCYPLVGMQSQRDPIYIEYQILTAKAAHIDGFFVEWGFREHKSNQELLMMLKMAEKYDFEVGINWCDAWHFYPWIEEFHKDAVTRERKVELFKENVQYLLDTLYSTSYGATVDGHPIILIFGGGPTLEEFSDIRNCSYRLPEGVKQPCFIVRAPINGTVGEDGKVNYYLEENGWPEVMDGMFGWIPTRVREGLADDGFKSWDRYAVLQDSRDYLDALYKAFGEKGCRVRIGSVNPEMDNRACASWNKHDLSHIPRERGKTYEGMWESLVDNSSQVDVAYIVSWNDYTESHQVEPTLQEGYRELLTTRKYGARWKGLAEESSAGWETEVLSLPLHLFQVRKQVEFYRKTGFQTEPYDKALDDIAGCLSNGRYGEAKLNLLGVEELISSLGDMLRSWEVELTQENGGLSLNADQLTICCGKTLEEMERYYFRACLSFEYLDDDEESFQILHGRQELCDGKKDGSGLYKQVRIRLFKESLHGIVQERELTILGNMEIRNVKLLIKLYSPV